MLKLLQGPLQQEKRTNYKIVKIGVRDFNTKKKSN